MFTGHKTIVYHTRLYSDNTKKISGGTFGGQMDQETFERMAQRYKVVVKLSGTAVFVDAQGREVNLYVSLSPRDTQVGKEAIRKWEEETQAQRRLEQQLEDDRQAEIDRLMSGLSQEEIIRRLSGE